MRTLLMSDKQHYVPNFILRNFASCDRTLWILDKNTGKNWAIKGGKNERYDNFAQNNYLPQDIDQVIGLLEEGTAPILKSILTDVRSGISPNLTCSDKESLCKFLVNLILRAPRVKDFGESLHSKLYYSMLQDNLDAEQDDEHPERDLFQKLLRMNVEFGLVQPGTTTLLVICDEPCWHSEKWVVMRIAKDVLIQLGNFNRPNFWIHKFDLNYVNELNREAMNKGRRFIAGPDCDTLQRLFTVIS